jgi:hypothetical protein
MATPEGARSLAIAAGATTFGLSAVRQIMRGDAPKLTSAFGSLGVAVVLSAIAGGAPGLAAAFAVLIITTAAFVNAGPLVTLVANLTT